MPVSRQKKALKKLIDPVTGEYNGKPAGKALREAGYSESVARNPKQVLESKGFRELLESCGLTPQFLGKALFDDIKAKKGRRVREIELAMKATGMLKEIPVQVNITLEDILGTTSQIQPILVAPERQAGEVIEMPRIDPAGE